jgi:hypothetical protein
MSDAQTDSPAQATDSPNLLIGHTSPETAYTVADYPYGFRLRCSIRYWIEHSLTRGCRFVSQTTNPKKAGNPWNKPKAGTYCRFGMAMYLDDDNHVQHTGLHEYMDAQQTKDWMNRYSAGVPESCKAIAELWTLRKLAYEERKADREAQGEDSWQAARNAARDTAPKPAEGL